jgi:plasmid replication initiation protein
MLHSLTWENAFSYEEIKRETIEKSRNQMVVKSNSLVQRSRFTLSLLEQNVLLFLISKIKPGDTGLEKYYFSFREFCDVCGITLEGDMYSYINETLGKLSDKSLWIDSEMDWQGKHYIGKSRIRWINSVFASETAGAMWIRFHEEMLPYLFKLREDFTKYQLRNVLALNSIYASALYELLKRFEYLDRPVDFSLDELKNELGADAVPSYNKYDNFRREVIERALREINTYTDLNVEYKPMKTGRKVTRIIFAFRRKETPDEKIKMLKNQELRFNPAKQKKTNPSQMVMEGM